MNQSNNLSRRYLSAFLTALVLTLAFSTLAFAQTTAFTYQGRFSDTTVAQPTNGTYTMTFRLFDAATGGNQIPNNTTAVTSMVSVVNGIFTVKLDFGAAAFNTTSARYLEIQVGSTILTPRQEITSTPFANRAANAAAADSLSAACVGCVTDVQISSISGAKVSGTVANAATATTANSATTATTAGNVTGVVGIANGGTGSATQNFVDLTNVQTIAGAKTFSNNLRTNGLIRAGIETGTSQMPVISSDSGNQYGGLVTRRINSSIRNVGQVAARTNVLRLERDGTNGGWRIANDALGDFDGRQSVYCLGINGTGAVIAARLQFSVNASGTTVLYNDAQNIEFMQCSFGNSYGYGQQTQVVLQRYPSDPVWIGTVTSTFNQ